MNLIGQSLGHYQILEQLGEGGMATVYRAYDTRLERDVAIKIIRREAFPPEQIDRILKRFEREAKALAKLSHPNIVKVLDFGEQEDMPYLVMEYLPGGSLKHRLKRKIYLQNALEILIPVTQALEYAHNNNIIHRDIKPSNILLTESGQPMLTDFGIAKLLETEETATLTGTGVGIGTPEYMAPEQGQGETDIRSDIYSLGIVLYEMVTGRKPYTADTPLAVLLKHISDPLPSPKQYVKNLPAETERVIIKALSKKPENRFQSMKEFSQALKQVLETEERRGKKTEKGTKHRLETPQGPENKKSQLEHKSKPWLWITFIGIISIVGVLVTTKGIPMPVSATNTPSPTLTPTDNPTNTPTEIVFTPEATMTALVPKNLTDAGTPATPQIITGQNIQTLEILTKLDAGADVNKIVFSPDSMYLAAIVGNRSLQIWDYLEGKLVASMTQQPGTFRDVILTNETLTASTCRSANCQDGGEILTWSLANQKLIETLGFPDVVINLPENGRAILAHYRSRSTCVNTSTRKMICIKWDIELWNISSEPYKKIDILDTVNEMYNARFDSPDRINYFPPVVFTSDANSIATANNNEVKVRDIADIKSPIVLDNTSIGDLYSLGLSPNDNLLVLSNGRVYDLKEGSSIRLGTESDYSVHLGAPTFSPDGSLLYVVNSVWNVANWEKMHTLSYEEADINIISTAFSPDGKFLATGGLNSPYIYLWGVK